MKIDRPTIKRREWRVTEDELHELHAMAFGKECKRPLKVAQNLLARLLLDFNAMCTRETDCNNS